MTNDIVEYRGVSDLVAAEVLSDNAEEYVTGAVFPIAGVAEISKTTDSSNEAHYYDNIPAVVVMNTSADEVNISASAIPFDVLGKLTGQKYDTSTGALIEGTRELKYFAVGYKTKKTNGDIIYVWRYKGTFNVPDQTNTTENDSTDANGNEIVYTGISTTHKFSANADANGAARGAKALVVDTAKELSDVSTFFDAVTTPDDLTPISPPAPTYYTVSYNVNGGTGSIDGVTVTAGSSILLDDGAGLTPPTGKELAGWAKTSGSSTPTVSSPYTPTGDTVLYAVWVDEQA